MLVWIHWSLELQWYKTLAWLFIKVSLKVDKYFEDKQKLSFTGSNKKWDS